MFNGATGTARSLNPGPLTRPAVCLLRAAQLGRVLHPEGDVSATLQARQIGKNAGTNQFGGRNSLGCVLFPPAVQQRTEARGILARGSKLCPPNQSALNPAIRNCCRLSGLTNPIIIFVRACRRTLPPGAGFSPQRMNFAGACAMTGGRHPLATNPPGRLGQPGKAPEGRVSVMRSVSFLCQTGGFKLIRPAGSSGVRIAQELGGVCKQLRSEARTQLLRASAKKIGPPPYVGGRQQGDSATLPTA